MLLLSHCGTGFIAAVVRGRVSTTDALANTLLLDECEMIITVKLIASNYHTESSKI